MNKSSKFQSNRFDSFHVSDLKVKLNQHRQFSKSTKIHQNGCFLPPKKNRPHSASLNIQCEEGFQSIRFDSFHVSDLNAKLNQRRRQSSDDNSLSFFFQKIRRAKDEVDLLQYPYWISLHTRNFL